MNYRQSRKEGRYRGRWVLSLYDLPCQVPRQRISRQRSDPEDIFSSPIPEKCDNCHFGAGTDGAYL